MTVTTGALLFFAVQAAFTVTILVVGILAAAGMLSREERTARSARSSERKRRAKEG